MKPERFLHDLNVKMVYSFASRSKIKFWRSNAQYSELRQQYCIIIIKLTKRLDLHYFLQ